MSSLGKAVRQFWHMVWHETAFPLSYRQLFAWYFCLGIVACVSAIVLRYAIGVLVIVK